MPAIDAWLAAARAGHFLACMLLFGEALYVYTVDPQAKLRGRVVAASLIVAVACAIAWLGIETVAMSGEALRAGLIATVLRATQYGHVWTIRACAVVMIAGAAWIALHANTERTRRSALTATLLLAGAHLAMVAAMGHASAAGGLRRIGDVTVDAVHLLAGGAWLGMLPALAATLASARSRETIVRVTRRFSQVAYVAVTAVVASGIVNAGLRNVGPIELVTTDYGRLLVLKLALVGAMIALAATNRLRLTPRLLDADGVALAVLRRNAWLEVALGVAVVLVVGALGMTPPPAMDMGMHGMH